MECICFVFEIMCSVWMKVDLDNLAIRCQLLWRVVSLCIQFARRSLVCQKLLVVFNFSILYLDSLSSPHCWMIFCVSDQSFWHCYFISVLTMWDITINWFVIFSVLDIHSMAHDPFPMIVAWRMVHDHAVTMIYDKWILLWLFYYMYSSFFVIVLNKLKTISAVLVCLCIFLWKLDWLLMSVS